MMNNIAPSLTVTIVDVDTILVQDYLMRDRLSGTMYMSVSDWIYLPPCPSAPSERVRIQFQPFPVYTCLMAFQNVNLEPEDIEVIVFKDDREHRAKLSADNTVYKSIRIDFPRDEMTDWIADNGSFKYRVVFKNGIRFPRDRRVSHSEKLGIMFRNREQADVVLVCSDGKEVHANQFFLASNSSVFKSMLSHKPYSDDLKSKGCVRVMINDADYETMYHMVHFMYTGKEELSFTQQSLNMLRAATKYDIIELRARCEEFLSRNYSRHLLIDTFETALNYDSPFLLKNVINYLKVKRFQVDQLIGYWNMSAERRDLLSEKLKEDYDHEELRKQMRRMNIRVQDDNYPYVEDFAAPGAVAGDN